MQCNADVVQMINLVTVFQSYDHSDDVDHDDDLQAFLDLYASRASS